MKSVVELADSGLESGDSSADSNADPAKVGIWLRAFRAIFIVKKQLSHLRAIA